MLLTGAFLVYASANAPVPVATELRHALGLTGSSAAIFLLPFAVGFGAGSFLWFVAARERAARLLLPGSLALMAAASLPLVFAGRALRGGRGARAGGRGRGGLPAPWRRR